MPIRLSCDAYVLRECLCILMGEDQEVFNNVFINVNLLIERQKSETETEKEATTCSSQLLSALSCLFNCDHQRINMATSDKRWNKSKWTITEFIPTNI